LDVAAACGNETVLGLFEREGEGRGVKRRRVGDGWNDRDDHF
jgi:hypothetical protein